MTYKKMDYHVICCTCNSEFIMKPRGYHYYVNRNIPFICRSCISKRYFNNLSEDAKNTIKERLIDNNSKLWNSITLEQKKKIVQSLRKGNKKYWDNISDIERRNHSNRSKEYWKNISKEELKNISKKISDTRIDEWNNLSEEERQLKLEILHEGYFQYFRNMTEDEFDVWKLKRSIGQSKANTKPKDTELEFMNLLKLYHMDYQFQWYNQIEHPDFKKLFPINPYNMSNKIFSSHNWDFIVYLKSRNILVDVDGSIHTLKQGRLINGFDVGGYIQFNDSQRPYQTDSFDAYIINAYNDRIEDDTPVLSLKTNKYMTYKQLMNMIYLESMIYDEDIQKYLKKAN